MTTCRPGEELIYETDGGVFGDNSEWRFVLEPTNGGGTRLTQSFRILSMPVWFDRMIWRTIPAHHDRTAALREDLNRLVALAEQRSPRPLAAAG